jgi:hypothetical protein
MDKRSEYRMFGFETTPRLNNGSFYIVDIDAVIVTTEDCFHMDEGQLERQDKIIKDLEQRIAKDTQKLIEKDRKMAQLELELEESCEEIFSRVNYI